MSVVIDGTLGISPVTPTGTSALVDGMTVGRGAGEVATNTAVGASALAANTTGAGNTAIGASSLSTNTTGGYNVAVGYQAAYTNTTGAGVTFVGYQSGKANTTGGDNTGVGALSLYSNTTGINNTASGVGALQNNTTANNNTAVGYQALYANTTGDRNIGIGTVALSANTTGIRNTVVGTYCYNNSTAGSYTTAIGHASGNGATGSYNTFIGESSGSIMESGTKNTILGRYNGNQGGLDIRTASNYIVLSDGDGNPRGVFDSAGAFLLNATAKVSGTTYFSVQGSTASSNIMEQKDTGTSYASGNYYQVYFNSTNGVAGGVAHTAATTVAFNTSSDVRLKKNIVDAPSALDKVVAAQVRSFDWKDDDRHVEYGFIAQELFEHFPEAVGQGDDASEIESPKSTWQVEYGRLTPMLIKAIQELKAEFDAYKSTHP